MSGSSLSFCMVTTFYPPHNFGGDGIYVHRLSNELARRGHRVTVVSRARRVHALLGGPASAAPAEHENVTLEPLEPPPGPVSPLVTYLTGRPGLRRAPLGELFARERFDVVHFHNVSLVGGPGVLAYGDGVKLYTTHEHWLVCPMHTLWRNNREPCQRPNCLRCTLAFAGRRSSGATGRCSSARRATSTSSCRRAASRSGCTASAASTGPMRHLPYFIPAPDARGLADADGEPARPYFLVVARLEKLKGVQTLIELFRRYDAADLVVVGDGTYGEELRRQAAGLSTSASSARCRSTSSPRSTPGQSPCSRPRSATRRSG